MTGRHASVVEVMGEKKRGKKISFFSAAGECEEDGKIKEERRGKMSAMSFHVRRPPLIYQRE